MSVKCIKQDLHSSYSSSEQVGYLIREATLQDVPDIIREIILDLLLIPDILNFRLASKDCKRWVECYPKLERRLYETIITFNSLTDVEAFNNTVTFPPFTSFELTDNVPLKESHQLCLFAKKNRANIVSLTLHTFGSCVSDFEYYFLESLPKIQKLHLKCIQPLEQGTVSRIPQKCLMKIESFGYDSSYTHAYPYSLLKFCKKLKYLRLGDNQFEDRNEENGRDLIEFLAQKYSHLQDGGGQDEIVIDFGPYDLHYYKLERKFPLEQFFKQIAQLKGKVQLLNLPTSLLWELRPSPPSFTIEDKNSFLFSIKSVSGVNDMLIRFIFPSLETIQVHGLNSACYYFPDFTHNVEPRANLWPKLKSVKGIVDTGKVEFHVDPDLFPDPPSNFKFYQRLFQPNRTSITTLDLEIDLSESYKRSEESINLLKNFPINFPNLKKLRLKCTEFKTLNFNHLLKLLAEHTKIEDLTLIFSSVMSDKTFFGNSRKAPLLLKLSQLKHLRLEIEGGNVKNFTTAAFVNIFALMPLLQFEIIDHSLQFGSMNITCEGFEALLSNQFGKTIQRFKFECGEISSPDGRRLLACLERIQQRCVLNNRY